MIAQNPTTTVLPQLVKTFYLIISRKIAEIVVMVMIGTIESRS